MIKRMNKITSLLVAAAAIASIVPATSVEAAVRLGNKEGTIKQGIAFNDGKYSYYGYKTDTDLTGVYSNNGTDAKETLNSDLEDYRLNTLSKFGTKYAYAYEQSNSDEYLIDLSTGKIVDDQTKEEKEDLAKANLITKIKRADRYNSWGVSSFNQILQGQFGDVWYQYGTDVAGENNVGEVKGEVEVTADANWNTLTVGDKTFNKTTVAGVTGYTSGSASSFAVQVASQKASFVNGFDFTSVDPATGVITLTQTAAGPFSAADAATRQAAAASYTNAKIELVTEGQAPGVVLVAGQKAVLKVTPVDLTKDVLVEGVNVLVTVGDKAGFVDVDGLKTQLLAASANGELGNYVVKDNKVDITGTVAKFTLAQKTGTTLNQSNVGFGGDGVTVLVTKTGVTGSSTEGSKGYTGFTNETGAYIDASYTANMKIYSATKGRAVTVAQFGEEVKDAGLKVDLVSIDAIAQDKDYIYTVTKVKVTGTGSVAEDQTFIQKISKAQGTKTDDGAYIPKEVKSYQLNNGIYDNDDASDASALLNGTNKDYEYLLGITVKDGNTIYVTRANKDEVKVYKIDLDDSVKSDVVANGATLKLDVDTALALSADDADEDVTSFELSNSADDQGLQGITAIKVSNEANADEVKLNGETLYKHPSVSIDVNGNTWTLKKGKITKFDGISKNADIYTVDGAMNAIDVYDDENLIAWDVEGDVYTTVTEGKAQTGTEAGNGNNTTPETPVETKKGWVKTEAGWTFYNADGSQTKGQWIQDGGVWYMIKADGIMATGWYKDNGTWYYLNGSGAMKTGWLNDNGTWYYLQGSGAMKTGWLNDNGTWYYLNGSGAMKTGWLNDNGTWYYLNGSGAMLSNTTVGGYRLGASGAWVK